MDDTQYGPGKPDDISPTAAIAPRHRRPWRRGTWWALSAAGVAAFAAIVVLFQLGVIQPFAAASPVATRSPETPPVVPTETPTPSLTPTPTPTPTAVPTTKPVPPTTKKTTTKPPPAQFTAWAYLDRSSGAITGSTNLTATSTTESMIKAWIAADDLSQLDKQGVQPDATELQAITSMIRDSDDNAAETIYRRNGTNAVVTRLISTCGLTDTKIYAYWWSLTQMSSRDAVRMGVCLADGRAAGPHWTDYLLGEMRNVRGEGRFGFVNAVPAGVASQLAIKNGWTAHSSDGQWHVNCLGVSAGWVLAAETRYPVSLGLSHGAAFCEDMARQHLPISSA